MFHNISAFRSVDTIDCVNEIRWVSYERTSDKYMKACIMLYIQSIMTIFVIL
ncbi:hypothetical protein [Amedibacillus sp. YH-ame10]